jgi:cysteinyl-tRNA synthetase
MKLYNSLTRKKEEFKPLEDKIVKMYVCGPTVYNYIHVGNARPMVVFDTLRRYFLYKGYDVKYVVNFTDIDDKLIKKAQEQNTTVKEIAEKYISEFLIDSKGLNVYEEKTIHPKATENISEIIKFIKRLEEKGFAYNIDGNVYFDISKDKNYGKLSNKNLNDLISGARVGVNEEKKNPGDFALWKKEKPGEPSWDSPWGKGRPGWHIECSVMSRKHLGDTIDIHAGGEDLQFPHHENEIAQSESLTGKPFARFWLHNGMINIDDKKMSKSLNNFFTVREVSKLYDLEVVRFFILSGHYRKPINYSKETIEQAKNSLERLYNGKRALEHMYNTNSSGEIDLEIKQKINTYKTQFEKAMEDDINTADAVSAMFDMVKFINTEFDEFTSKETVKMTLDSYNKLAQVLGILYKEDESLSKEAKNLIDKRKKARKDKDYELADKLRDELLDLGIQVEDTREGMKWKKIN